MDSGWQFWIDRGGTFTDVVGRAPDGSIRVHKLLSENPGAVPRRRDPGHPRPAGPGHGRARCPPSAIDAVKMGTTVATNALLERKGDADRARDHARPRRRAAHRLPEPARHLRAPHRAARAALRRAWSRSTSGCAPTARSSGRSIASARVPTCERRVRCAAIARVAIVLMHGYRYHAHELARGRARPRRSASPRSRSATRSSPLMKLVGRGDTTVVDAYLSPILRALRRPGRAAATGDVRLMFMQSQRRPGRRAAVPGQGRDPVRPGGRHRRRGAGPRRWPGFDRIIGFDMGGTSTDVSHYAGAFERALRHRGRGRAHARADDDDPHRRGRRRLDPQLRRRSASGSGPRVAGANPGPACYRRGGPLTVTDANLMVGKLLPALLPAACSGPTPTSRSTPRWCAARSRRWRTRSRGRPASSARPRSWRRAASPSPSTTWPTRSRRSRSSAAIDVTALRAVLLRRRRRAARLPGRRPAGHQRVSSSTRCRRALGLRHGPRGPARAAPAGDRGGRSTQALIAELEAAIARARGRRRVRELRAQGVPPSAIDDRGAGARPLRRHRHLARGAAGRCRRDARGVRGRAPRRASASSSRAAALVVEAGHGRGDRRHGGDRRARAAGGAARARDAAGAGADRRRSSPRARRTSRPSASTPPVLQPRGAAPGRSGRRAGADLSSAHHHGRGRARLGAGGHARATI